MDTQPAAPASHPLRPYSVSPKLDDWSWSSPSSSSSSSARPTASTFSSSSTPPSLRLPVTNRYESSFSDLDDVGAGLPTAGTMLRAFVTSSLLSFTGVAMVQPFEVGKTLLQVQWVPKDGLDLQAEFPDAGAGEEVSDEVSRSLGPTRVDPRSSRLSCSEAAPLTLERLRPLQIEDEAEAEAYFSDLASVAQPSFAPPPSARPTDPSGYLTRSGVNDSALGTKPEWVMPIVVQGGVWDMIKAVGRWKGEGWSSLWKGQLTSCIIDGLATTVQPFILTCLTVVFLPSSSFSSLPIIYSPKPGPLLLFSTISHAVTTVLLSPLDLVRTRLIVQSAQPAHRKYSNPFHALRTILHEEGGLKATYFHPNLFLPAILEGVFRPLIHLATPLIITRYLHLEPSTSPLSYGLAELVLSTAGLLVTIPLETIRRRLQIQSRAEFVRAGRAGGVGRPWRTCVETRPAPYAGMVEAVYRILTEETGKIPRRRRLRRRSSAGPGADKVQEEEEKEDLSTAGLGASGGLRQLYRGLGMGLGANVVVFLLGLVAGGQETSSGWAEM
ncbi:SPOSA6832_00863 [Sporobolomyces salmonicolor]|uniref:SPOSA6832_00863-mRNA-1:cds n=1 Tax=Sporidiobolus salmonicolor TaxID=5005 RepID=A0A0D6EID2_SPOSA|nr:SPOSA6832_00863 [Sporobolomyces salmonicolor]